MNILIFLVEALFVGAVALLAYFLSMFYILDLIFVFISSGVAVVLLSQNPTIAIIVAMVVSFIFHMVRHTSIMRGVMIIISSALLGIVVFLVTKLLGGILLAVVNTAIAVGINIYERVANKYKFDE